MVHASVDNEDVDIVICALRADLRSFMEGWRPIFSRFHLIIVKDPDLKQELQLLEGFNVDVYTKPDIINLIGHSAATLFTGYSVKYLGYLISKRKYVISFDDDCLPAKDEQGVILDPVVQHVRNLATPATPFFFNTLYDPLRDGSDFVRGYPFGLRSGARCALSCGLWLNMADYDAPTRALKLDERNSRYVDLVMTVPYGASMPICGANFGFDRELLAPVMFSGLRLTGEGKVRWETIEDIWCGMCVKAICDHLRLGVKTGLPYVWREECGDAVESLRKEWEGMKLMEQIVPFFESLRFSERAASAQECVVELAAIVKEKLGPVDMVFARAADAMLAWVELCNVFQKA